MDLYIISLKRSISRREKMLCNPLYGIKHEFFDAVDARVAGPEALSRYDREGAIRRFGLPLTPGEVGCFASHHALWERCAASGRPIAVMEDDVALSERFRQAMRLADELIMEHRFIRLAGQKERKSRGLQRLASGFSLVRFSRGPSGTQCYCVSPEGARVLLAGAERWVEPVDTYIDSYWRHGLTPKGIIPFEAHELDREQVASTIGDRTKHRTGYAKLRHEVARVGQNVARVLFDVLHPAS